MTSRALWAWKGEDMELTDLPNIGPVLAENLRKIGVETPEAFREKAEIFFRDLLRQLHHITEGGHER